MKAKDAIKHLKEYDPDEEVCMILWVASDVEVRAEEMGVKASPKLIASVLSRLERRHDAEIGITWDNVDWAIEEVAPEQVDD